MSNDFVPPDREPLGELPPLPRASRLAVLKSLGVLSLAVVSAACIGGAIGLGIHWANQANEATESHASASLSQPSPSTPGRSGKAETGETSSNGTPASAPPQSSEVSAPPWFIPSSNLPDAYPGTEPIYLYQVSDAEMRMKIALLRDLFAANRSLAEDGSGGFIAEGDGGWLLLSSEGAGYWSYSKAGASNPSCAPLSGALSPPSLDENLPTRIDLQQSGVLPSHGCMESGINAPLLSQEQAQLLSTEILDDLNLPLDGLWSFSVTADGARSASLSEAISGKPTGLMWNFVFDAKGNVIRASGHLAHPIPLEASPTISPRQAVERANSQPWASLIEKVVVTTTEADSPRDCEAPCSEPSDGFESPAPTTSFPATGDLLQNKIPLLVYSVEISSAEMGFMRYQANRYLLLIPAWVISGNDSREHWAIPALADTAYEIP